MQGDPLSHFLFIMSYAVMTKTCDVGVFHGNQSPNNGSVVSHLFYAEDVLFVWD